MLIQIFIFVIAIVMVMQGAVYATTHATKLAQSFRLSSYTVGFLVIAVISILPETFIATDSALTGNSSFGFGVLIGSNVADLTLVIAALILLSRRALKVEYRILKSHALYPFILLLPLLLGLDGHFSRPEGAALILVGAVFYYLALRGDVSAHTEEKHSRKRLQSILFLLLSMFLLLVGAHFTVSSATTIAESLGVSSVLIGMLVVALGTTLPELFFSLKAMKAHDDSLAIGDILGTVLADATIVVGLLALINPFSFPHIIIYVAGIFMVAAAFILFSFMRSGRLITGREAFVLFVFWLTFVLIQGVVNL